MSRLTRVVNGFRVFLVVASAALAVFSVVHYGDLLPSSDAHEHALYWCPMHPEITSDRPGTCPICSMQLEPIPARTTQNLVLPFDAGVPALPPPAGRTTVELTTTRAQSIGVRTEPVSRGALDGVGRYPAVLVAREGSVAEVRFRVPTFVESLAVDHVGARVRRGQLLLSGFSPELARADDQVAAALALDPSGELARAADEGRGRLAAGPARRDPARPGRISLHAPRAGVVTRLEARRGAFAGPEALLFEITDTSRLYVVATVDESTRAQLGEAAEVEAGERRLSVTFESVEPAVDALTRRTRVRYVVENADGRLLPGAPVTLLGGASDAEALRVPRDAIVDTGDARYVFVDRGLGFYEPRSVEVGPGDATHVHVTRGLEEGENVVVRGGFLLDSESRLRAAVSPVARDGGTP